MRAKALARCERIEAGDDTIAEALGELGADPQRLEVLPPLQVDPPELPAKAEAHRQLWKCTPARSCFI